MSKVILEATGLAKTYKEGSLVTPVFENLNLVVAQSETLAIVGASGSGKSTLLHLMAGLDSPTAGDVSLMGLSLPSQTEAEKGRLRNRHLGFIYQFHHLLPEFTALENAMMPLLIAGVAVKQAGSAAEQLLAQVGLSHRLHHKPGELSGGERQRVAVARALVNQPACVLADEPTGNLDEKTAASVFDLMLELQDRHGTSLVIVTHDPHLADACGRSLELFQGALRDRPQ